MATKKELSAGGVIFQKTPQGIVYLLGKHSGYHKWVLPKGLIEKGEQPEGTAVRETEEEMGVKTKLVNPEPLHTESYFYYADLKDPHNPAKSSDATRRVETYQEQGGNKTRVHKTVTLYLLEYVSGDPKDHGWEMEDAGWFTLEEALQKMSFEGEKQALQKANNLVS